MKFAIDFDGTCVTHKYPEIGEDIGAVPVLQELVDEGHTLILFTMRSGKELNDAVTWFHRNGIILHGINEDPGQKRWTQSPKAYAQVYIDDAALGCPLIYEHGEKPYVDWVEVRNTLIERQIL